MSFATISKIIYFWARKYPQDIFIHELHISHTTIVDFYNFCREVCSVVLERDSEPIGGPGKIVETHESKFKNRKYNRGRCVDGCWVCFLLDYLRVQCRASTGNCAELRTVAFYLYFALCHPCYCFHCFTIIVFSLTLDMEFWSMLPIFNMYPESNRRRLLTQSVRLSSQPLQKYPMGIP